MCEGCKCSKEREQSDSIIATSVAELADLRAIGDTMQSALSRVTEYLDKRENYQFPAKMGYPGYETMMAVLEGKSAIEKWTEARKQSR